MPDELTGQDIMKGPRVLPRRGRRPIYNGNAVKIALTVSPEIDIWLKTKENKSRFANAVFSEAKLKEESL